MISFRQTIDFHRDNKCLFLLEYISQEHQQSHFCVTNYLHEGKVSQVIHDVNCLQPLLHVTIIWQHVGQNTLKYIHFSAHFL